LADNGQGGRSESSVAAFVGLSGDAGHYGQSPCRGGGRAQDVVGSERREQSGVVDHLGRRRRVLTASDVIKCSRASGFELSAVDHERVNDQDVDDQPVVGASYSSVAILTSRSTSADRGSSAAIRIQRLVGVSKQAFFTGGHHPIRVIRAGWTTRPPWAERRRSARFSCATSTEMSKSARHGAWEAKRKLRGAEIPGDDHASKVGW
jgi:hypothetical protein